MMFALFPNTTKKQTNEFALEIIRFLESKKMSYVINDDDCGSLPGPALSSIGLDKIDFVISLGGDGTILRMIHTNPLLAAPIIAINLGGLGFMADTKLDEITSCLQHVIDGNFTIHERIMMQAVTSCGDKCFAVNEISVHRAHNPNLIDLSIFVNGTYLNTFSADGVIIATPTGSTAYSLAAGGPILAPDLEAFVITPICPHTLSNRPIVLKPNEKITVRYLSPKKPVEVAYDGFCQFHLKTDDEIQISLSPKKFRLVSLPHHDYFSTLREKLGWAGKLKA